MGDHRRSHLLYIDDAIDTYSNDSYMGWVLGSSLRCCKLFYGATRVTLAVLFFYFSQQNVDTFLYFCRQTENTEKRLRFPQIVDKNDTFCGEIFHIYIDKERSNTYDTTRSSTTTWEARKYDI